MPQFIVRVGMPDGEIVEPQVQAANVRAAQEEMRQLGVHVFDVKRGSVRVSDLLPTIRRVVSTEKFLLFTQELLALGRVGFPVLPSSAFPVVRRKNAWCA